MKIYFIPLIILILDQFSKFWVKANFTPYAPVNIIGHYLRITFCENPGIAFGISVGSFHIYITILSYLIAIGLVYYLILQNNSVVDKKMFKKKNLFKGKVGIFEIKNNKINHILNFYKVEDGEFKKVF